jgi:hypothetical protein
MPINQLPNYCDSIEEAKEVAENLLYLLERSSVEISEDARSNILAEIQLICSVCYPNLLD